MDCYSNWLTDSTTVTNNYKENPLKLIQVRELDPYNTFLSSFTVVINDAFWSEFGEFY